MTGSRQRRRKTNKWQDGELERGSRRPERLSGRINSSPVMGRPFQRGEPAALSGDGSQGHLQAQAFPWLRPNRVGGGDVSDVQMGSPAVPHKQRPDHHCRSKQLFCAHIRCQNLYICGI
ncbi:hypothetical protein AAFF_G00110690 [Aldrovandia affinis]|uniref:Uncharacterized protein n=1 Tax=Aldrovandia affinis TaxID=143900 RepID=A0AAD7RTT0_9TELE|nr:hypothetical protein AAFF_G00110690 [Aldrovandia affinis]